MGCCDSQERKNIYTKKQDLSYNEESTDLDQEDFKTAMLRKHLQRSEREKQARKRQNPTSLQHFIGLAHIDLRKKRSSKQDQNKENETLQVSKMNKNDDDHNISGCTQFYTPQNETSEILHSQQDDSFMLDLHLDNSQKHYYEYDPQNRKAEIKHDFQDQSEQIMKKGSVPIFLKNSKTFIIPSNTNKIDMKLFLEETKQALETLQQNQALQLNLSKETSCDIDDAEFGSPNNSFNYDGDRENNSLDTFSISSKIFEHFYELNDMNNLIAFTNQLKNIKMENRWDYINIEQELNSKEQKVFHQLKDYLNDQIDYPFKQKITDHYLVRFLRAKKFDFEKTKKFLENHIQWRIKENIDQIHEYKFEEYEQVQQYLPHGLHYSDKEGRPVYVERIGQIDYSKLFEVTTKDRLRSHYIQFYEKMINHIFQMCTAHQGKKIDKMVIIIDCKDMSIRLDQITSFLKTTINIIRENYPEILHKLYFVNTGMMFNFAWKAVQLLVNGKIKNKICILGSKFIRELEKEIPIENIPKFLGGQCQCNSSNCINYNYGP